MAGLKKIKVRVWYGEVSRVVEIGYGAEQTIKWLATVAAQRFTSDVAPRGALRQRDILSILPLNAVLLPSEVSSTTKSFYHPDAKIIESVQEDEILSVKLESKQNLNEVSGEPEQSRWFIIAFTQSKHMQHRKTWAIHEEERVQAEKVRKEAQIEQNRKYEDNRTKAVLMRKLLNHQLLSADDLEMALDHEWEWMNRRGKIDAWVRTPKDKETLRLKIRDNFLSLLELFRFYGASTTTARDSDLMEFVEFCSFCRDIELFGSGNEQIINHTTLAGCFAEIAGISVAEVKQGHFRYGDFLASLVWLALTTKGVNNTNASAGGGGGPNATHSAREAIESARRAMMRLGRDLGTNQGSAFSIPQAVQQLLDENIALAFRTHQSQLIGSITKEHLATDTVLATLYVHRQHLENVFMTYLSNRPECFLMDRGYMTMNEFVLLLEESKLIGSSGGDGDHDLLTMKEVRQAFAGSQDDIIVTAKKEFDSTNVSAVNIDIKSPATHKNQDAAANTKTQNQSVLLSFPEFLEAILRLALLKWDDDSYSITEKLTMAIDIINQNCLSSTSTSAKTSNGAAPASRQINLSYSQSTQQRRASGASASSCTRRGT